MLDESGSQPQSNFNVLHTHFFIMKLKSFYLFILLALLVFPISSQTVKISGRQILLNGQRYRINGICYSRGGSGNYTQDIALMKEANINTIRTYNPISDKAELDAFASAGIKIIMHLNENDFENYVNTYKTHQAILMWEFGNEFNYHPDSFGGNINTWYAKLQNCATRVHELDTNHPVSTAHGEVPDANALNSCPDVDVWGMNLYRWDNDVPAITLLASRSSKAIYVSECGGDSYNKAENQVREDQQAQAVRNIINGIIGQYDLCLGATVFEFCDEWWKAGSDGVQNVGGSAPNSSFVPYDGSADEEYWGIVRRDRSKKGAFDQLKAIYASVSQTITGVSGLNGTYFLQNRNSGMNMDVVNGNEADGTNIQQWTPTGDAKQQFTLTDLGDGIYKIICVKTGKSLDVTDVSTENFANVQQWSYTGANNQQFIIKSTDNGFYKFIIKHSGKIIEVRESGKNAGDNVNQYDDNGQINGQWKLVPVTEVSVNNRIEAESFNNASEVQVESCSEGGSNVGYIDTGNWMSYNSINFPTTGKYCFEFRIASISGGQLSVDLNSGSVVLGSVQIPATGDWQNWETVKFYANVNAGTYNLGLYAKTGGWNINWIQIQSVTSTLDKTLISQITVYPNPAKDQLFIQTEEDVTISIYDMLGKIKCRKVFERGINKIDVSDYKIAMYIVKVYTNKSSESFIFRKD